MGDGGWRGVRGGGTAWITRSRCLLDSGLGGIYHGQQRRRCRRPPTHSVVVAVAHSCCLSPLPLPLPRRPPRARAPSSWTLPTIPPPRRRCRCCHRRRRGQDLSDCGNHNDGKGDNDIDDSHPLVVPCCYLRCKALDSFLGIKTDVGNFGGIAAPSPPGPLAHRVPLGGGGKWAESVWDDRESLWTDPLRRQQCSCYFLLPILRRTCRPHTRPPCVALACEAMSPNRRNMICRVTIIAFMIVTITFTCLDLLILHRYLHVWLNSILAWLSVNPVSGGLAFISIFFVRMQANSAAIQVFIFGF